MKLLDTLNFESDLQSLSIKQLKQLCQEIREFIIEVISKTGGHFAPNLGVIELTVAMYYVFGFENSKYIFDVGHQSYIHKILTGRKNQLSKIRQKDGISGFCDYNESKYDYWESGHAGTSISAMCGFLYANSIDEKKEDIITIIGDSSINNGTSFEGLTYLSQQKFNNKSKGIIILNDNEMSITKSVGGFNFMLTKMRGAKWYRGLKSVLIKILPSIIYRCFSRIKRSLKGLFQRKNMFEELGYFYHGPIDGHDLSTLIKTFELSKRLKTHVVIHVLTIKGLGYEKAESDKEGVYHGVSPFNVDKGIVESNEKDLNNLSWSEASALALENIYEFQTKFITVQSAMTYGTGLTSFANKYSQMYTDVGIAEEHAAVMAASISLQKKKVYIPYYSTFSQRAFDQILNDIARPNLHAVIGIDRAGIVNHDGQTHQGLYDIAMFSLMPNTTILTPFNYKELLLAYKYAFYMDKGVFIVRYPKDCVIGYDKSVNEKYQLSSKIECSKILEWKIINDGINTCIITYQRFLKETLTVNFVKELGYSPIICNATTIKPLDKKILDKFFDLKIDIIVYEETINFGSLFQQILDYKNEKKATNKIVALNLGDKQIGVTTYEREICDQKISANDLIIKIKKMNKKN